MLERITLCLPLLFTLACDSGDETVEPRSAEDPDEVAVDDHHGKHGKHGDHGAWRLAGDNQSAASRGRMRIEHLCGEIACTDDQREAIGELLAANAPHHGPEGDNDEREAHHQALADAFRADSFDPSALPQPSPDQQQGHLTDKATMIVGLHDLLTAEQRETIAAKIESGDGPMGMLGRGHGEIDRDDKPEHDPAKHAERKVERLCELVTCTEAQVEQLGTIFTDALAEFGPPEPPKVDDAVKARFATAFRAETLAIADVESLLATARPAKSPKHEQMGELLAAVHGVLTAEQRALLADKLEEHGPHALMGGKGKHGGKGNKGDKGKRGDKGKHGDKGKKGASRPV